MPRWVLAVVVTVIVVAALEVAVLVGTHGSRSDTAAAQPAQGVDQVAVIDPRSQHVVERVQVGHTPTAAAAGYGGACVLIKADGTLSHIGGRSRRVVGTARLDVTANDLAIGDGGVWFAGRPRSGPLQPLEVAELERIDPATGTVDRTLDARTGAAVIASIPVYSNALAVAHGEGAVWVACRDDSVVRVDPKTDRVGAQIHVGALPHGIAAGAGAVWVTLG